MTNVLQTVYACLLHTTELALLASFFKWSDSWAPNGCFWLVLGASWSRIWNKWFPTKKWIEKGSVCQESPNIWENTHWLASFTWNGEYVAFGDFFSLWQKVQLQFLCWEVSYCLIKIFKLNTKLMDHRNIAWKGLLVTIYSSPPVLNRTKTSLKLSQWWLCQNKPCKPQRKVVCVSSHKWEQ